MFLDSSGHLETPIPMAFALCIGSYVGWVIGDWVAKNGLFDG